MRAAIMRSQQIVVDELEAPTPGAGEVLVKTLACGICGSDLHALKHADQLVAASEETGGGFSMDLQRDVVLGHEFCAEILEHGSGTTGALTPGTRVVSMPFVLRQSGPVTIGYSNDLPGGYAEKMVLSEGMLLPVPNGLSIELAALTEPMAVGYHAVVKSNVQEGDVPLVIGCGPVGLAVVVALKTMGVGPVIAGDFSPRRRELAEAMGADVVVDPATVSPYESWAKIAASDASGNALPLDPLTGKNGLRPGVIFECVGVPGLIDQVMRGAPRDCRIVVVGVCMGQDQITPMLGINKELNLQFVLGYSPDEFAATLHSIAEGAIDIEPLVTGKVGLDGVADAFEALASPDVHAKILIDPSL